MAYISYTAEMSQFIEDNYMSMSTAELVDQFNMRFGTEASYYAIKKYKENHGLKNGRVGGSPPMKYTEEMHLFMREYVPGHTYKEIQAEFENVFKQHISLGGIKSYLKNHHLNTGFTGRFVKGSIPANKGQKMSSEVYEKCKATMFKPGQEPVNHRQVGSERITKDGYIEVKIAEPNKWRLKHLVVWEKANGPIPKGYVLLFLDSDKTNTDISNLKLIKRSELLVMNRFNIYGNDAETMDVAANLAQLIDKTYKTKRK